MERILRSKLLRGRFVGVTLKQSRRMRAVRGRGNKSTELRLRLALVRSGLKGWCIGPKQVPGRPDFYFPEAKVAVFVDGCFWHGCWRCGHYPAKNSAFWKAKIQRNRLRDRRMSQKLRRSGMAVVRFWEHELGESLEECIHIVNCVLRRETRRIR
ncbi:MAG: very short patch repair endonuclease [Verrucomicrobiia bacterium]